MIEKELKIKEITFKNRVVMAPTVCFGWDCTGGVMSQKHIEHYVKRAQSGVGLIILQSILINESDVNDCSYAGIYNDYQIKYLSELSKECHLYGTKVFAQLQFSDLTKYREKTCKINTYQYEFLDKIKEDYISAIKRCKLAGLDGVEIHGAHTYFLNMITSSIANKRQDKYGNSTDNRIRFVEDIIKGSKDCINDHFIVSYRMGWEANFEEDAKVAKRLIKVGVELLHISTGIPINRNVDKPPEFRFNSCVYVGTRIKKEVDIPVIVVNDIKNYRNGNFLVENNLTDFVAYGKNFLADSDFLVKSKKNDLYEACIKCSRCKWFENGELCPVNNGNIHRVDVLCEKSNV